MRYGLATTADKIIHNIILWDGVAILSLPTGHELVSMEQGVPVGYTLAMHPVEEPETAVSEEGIFE